MKKIGLVGGISWTSTMEYYKLINEGVNQKLGGLNFAECISLQINLKKDFKIPVFDTTKIHTDAIVEYALN